MLSEQVIKAVRALAKFNSFQEAAQSLNMSAATFSRHIGRAETYCGFQLFERRKNGSAPTEAGLRFLELANEFNASLARFEMGLRQTRAAQDGLLRIGCGPLASNTIVQPILSRLYQRHPGLRLKLIVRATKDPIDALRLGALDVVVLDLTHTMDLGNLDIRMIRKRSVGFFARAGHPVHQRGPITVPELLEYPLASPHIHKHWRASLAAMLGGDRSAWNRVAELPAIECDDFSFLIKLTEGTDHICSGMVEVFDGAIAAGTHREVKLANPLPWNMCVARRSGYELPALALFWDALVQEFAA